MDRINTPDIVLQAIQLSKEVTSPEGLLTILDSVDLTVSSGESIAVVGVSGAGKSTLLGLLAGLDVPSKGKVMLNGQDFSQLDEDGRAALRSGSVGFVFQSFHLIPSLTALENVMLPLELTGHASPKATAMETLEKVGLTSRASHYPRQLSGGEKQRVAIARAFVVAPDVLFADEPTGNLDHRTGKTIIDLLFRLNQETGATLVLVTHDLKLAQRCDRIFHMDDGRITSVESPQDGEVL
ncbi:MAG: putative ABC transport system ATP-binding protein [Lysobacterales bacterium]|jgi:putative ABC transport system ATP-binding protein